MVSILSPRAIRIWPRAVWFASVHSYLLLPARPKLLSVSGGALEARLAQTASFQCRPLPTVAGGGEGPSGIEAITLTVGTDNLMFVT